MPLVPLGWSWCGFILLVVFVRGMASASTTRRCNTDSDCCGLFSLGSRAVCLNGTCTETSKHTCISDTGCIQDALGPGVWPCPDIRPVFSRCWRRSCVYASKSPPDIAGSPTQCPACFEFAPACANSRGWGTCTPVVGCCGADSDCDPCYACNIGTGVCAKKQDCCMTDGDCERDGEWMCDAPRCAHATSLALEGICTRGLMCSAKNCADRVAATADTCTNDLCGCCHPLYNDASECADDGDCRGWQNRQANQSARCIEILTDSMTVTAARCVDPTAACMDPRTDCVAFPGDCRAVVCDPISGVCMPPPSPRAAQVAERMACDDGDMCTDDFCDPDTGVCFSVPIECPEDGDGDACTFSVCDPMTGTCDVSARVECRAEDPCVLSDGCDPVSGECVWHPVPVQHTDVSNTCLTSGCAQDRGGYYTDLHVCDDGDPCTDDFCQDAATNACGSVPRDCGCGSDGRLADNPCVLCGCAADADPPGCSYAPVPCADGTAATADFCDPATGDCVHTQLDCAAHDGGRNRCIEWTRDPATAACVPRPRDPPVDTACVSYGECDPATGLFPATKQTCRVPTACHASVCDAATGECTEPAPVDCPAHTRSRCEIGRCDPATGACVYDPVECPPDMRGPCWTAACDPATGECVGTKTVCADDGDACTRDFCDPKTGECVHELSGQAISCAARSKPCVHYECDPADGWCAPALAVCERPGEDCDPRTGECAAPAAADEEPHVWEWTVTPCMGACDDQDECTLDSCARLRRKAAPLVAKRDDAPCCVHIAYLCDTTCNPGLQGCDGDDAEGVPIPLAAPSAGVLPVMILDIFIIFIFF